MSCNNLQIVRESIISNLGEIEKSTTSLEKPVIFFFFFLLNHNFPACNEWRAVSVPFHLSFFILIHCCNIWGLTGILPAASWQIFPSASLQGPPLVSRIPSHFHFPSRAASFHTSQFFYSRALLDAFPSPERVSMFSWMGRFPIIGLRAGKRKGWGM